MTPEEKRDFPYVEVRQISEFDSLLEKGLRPITIAFTDKRCPHCRTLQAPLKGAARRQNHLVLNVDQALNDDTRRLHEIFGINGVPTILKLASNNKMVRYSGDRTAESLLNFMITE